MSSHRYSVALVLWIGLLLPGFSTIGHAQSRTNPLEYQIVQGPQRLTMYANSSKILTLQGKEIPRAQVNNTDLLKVVPLSPNQIQVVASKAGVTQINLWDQNGELYTVDVIVYGDAKELELLLESEFPNTSLKVRPLATSVVLSGWVDQREIVNRVVRIAEDYYPKVINNITVGGVQQVMLSVQVMEVSRTKLRQIGFDWANFGHTDTFGQSVSGLIADVAPNASTAVGSGGATVTFGLFGQDNAFYGFVDALRQHDLAKILAEPVLTTVSGRPASFNVGGEFPIMVPQGLGSVAIEYKQFGTRVDFVPMVLGNGNIRLEVRPQVSEIDPSRGVDVNGTRIPGLRTRWVDTAVEMRAGQTLALAGLIQERTEAQTRGLPFLADLPWAGTFFRRNSESINEIELLVMVRPELVDAMDPSEVPQFGPGERTGSPSDSELFFRGYIEVPQCCQDGSCAKCRPGSPAMVQAVQEGLSVPGASDSSSLHQPQNSATTVPQGPVTYPTNFPAAEVTPDFDMGARADRPAVMTRQRDVYPASYTRR